MDSGTWAILSPIERQIKEKILQIGVPLKEWDIHINYGVKTGFNDAFIINSKTKAELIRLDPKSAEIIRPILRGRDIKRYRSEFADIWLIYVPWHFPLHKDPTITGASEKAETAFKSSYPAVYNHLLQYKEELSNRNKAETGIRYEWYALQRWGANYSDDFSKQKIVWGNLNLTASYTLADEGMFINAPCTMIVPGDPYLLAVLNSRLADYYIRSLGVIRNGGYFEYKPMFIEQLPVPVVDKSKQIQFSNLVKQIISLREAGSNSEKLERELDLMIFELYDLSPEEIEFLLSGDSQVEVADAIDLVT